MPRKPVETDRSDRAERAVLVLLEIGRAPKRTRQQALASAVADDDNSSVEETSNDGIDSGPSHGATSVASGEQAAEFRELVRSAGAEIVAEIWQRRDRPEPSTLIGGGKVEEAAAVAASTNADVVLFAHDLSPSQLRNLEKALPCRVIDRTQLILDIFARHARTREGQLQVELAQLSYMLPRLGGRGTALSQQGGGIGTRGPGERKLETDRRRINRRMDHIRAQLEKVRASRRQQRQRREAVPVPTVALVGYTNAGKSTLFNALTQAGVLESSRMFATLDPKLRAITLPSRRRVLLADTVGFVRDLPHTLVTSFRATLEEVQQAEVLLHVRDAASPTLDRQRDDVETVLAELEVGETPRIEVLNKSDLLSPEEAANIAQREAGIAVSGLRATGLNELLLEIERHLLADPMEEGRFRLPQSEGRVLAALEGGSTVLRKKFQGNIAYLDVAGPASLLGRYRHFRLRDEETETSEASLTEGRNFT